MTRRFQCLTKICRRHVNQSFRMVCANGPDQCYRLALGAVDRQKGQDISARKPLVGGLLMRNFTLQAAGNCGLSIRCDRKLYPERVTCAAAASLADYGETSCAGFVQYFDLRLVAHRLAQLSFQRCGIHDPAQGFKAQG